MATIGTRLYTFFTGNLVGEDAYGNKYYEAKKEKNAIGKKKRWVVYRGIVDASKVLPQWHGWLHYTHDILPDKMNFPQYEWLKQPSPNLTGTTLAYVPSGHPSRGVEHATTMAEITIWKP